MKRRDIFIALISLLIGFLIFYISNKFLIPSNSPNIDSVSETQLEATATSTWTCSMHPQIRKSEPGECPICGMDLIPIQPAENKSSSDSKIHTLSPEAVALANIQTYNIQLQSPEAEVHLTGKISVNEKRLAVITANYSGRIEKLFIDFTGQSVAKGQKLATIYSPELITAQRELLEVATNKKLNPDLYRAAREKLKLWQISDGQIDAIEKTGTTVSEFEILAEISGVVLARKALTGDYVSKGSLLFEIADLSTVWVLLDAYESDLPWIKKGGKINFTTDAIPGKIFSSKITFMDPVINPQTRTLSVRAETENLKFELKPEMFVKAKVRSRMDLQKKSLLIPKSSVLWTGTRSIVYIKLPDRENPTFEMREITLGPRTGGFYVVEKGITSGEEVVTHGAFSVDAAAQLSGNKSMMNRLSDTSMASGKSIERKPKNHSH